MGSFFDKYGYSLKDLIIENVTPEIEDLCQEAQRNFMSYASSCIEDFYNDYHPFTKEEGDALGMAEMRRLHPGIVKWGYYKREYSFRIGEGGLTEIPVHKTKNDTWKFGLRQDIDIHTTHDSPAYVFSGVMFSGIHGTSAIAVSEPPWRRIRDYYNHIQI